MKTSQILASTLIALASVAAGSAFAADHDYPVVAVAPSTSGVTRAQVQAELAQARQDGTWAAYNNDQNYPVLVPTGTPKTRAQVQAELAQAVRDGTMPVIRS